MLRRDPLANPAPLIRRVYAYVACRVGDGPDAQDITGETFERAVRYRSRYDPRRGEPLTWLIGIARRAIADAFSEQRALPLDAHDVAGSQSLEEDAVLRAMLQAAVASLDERDRELIALRYFADLTARQIAALTGARTNAIEVALHRALARLRLTLTDLSPERDVVALPQQRPTAL